MIEVNQVLLDKMGEGTPPPLLLKVLKVLKTGVVAGFKDRESGEIREVNLTHEHAGELRTVYLKSKGKT